MFPIGSDRCVRYSLLVCIIRCIFHCCGWDKTRRNWTNLLHFIVQHLCVLRCGKLILHKGKFEEVWVQSHEETSKEGDNRIFARKSNFMIKCFFSIKLSKNSNKVHSTLRRCFAVDFFEFFSDLAKTHSSVAENLVFRNLLLYDLCENYLEGKAQSWFIEVLFKHQSLLLAFANRIRVLRCMLILHLVWMAWRMVWRHLRLSIIFVNLVHLDYNWF